jgi:hypothetical protein
MRGCCMVHKHYWANLNEDGSIKEEFALYQTGNEYFTDYEQASIRELEKQELWEAKQKLLETINAPSKQTEATTDNNFNDYLLQKDLNDFKKITKA